MAEKGPDIESNIKFQSKGLDKVKGDVAGLAADVATLLTALTAGGSKVNGLFTALGGILVGRILGPLGLITGALFGVLGAMKLVVSQTQLMAKGLEVIKNLEFLETQFKPLLNGAALAKERIKELFVFAATTPFQLPGIVEASRVLEVLTQGALSTGKALTMIGDAAAVAGQPLENVAFWVGRLYDALQSGAPIGEAVMRLQEMGLISGKTRRQLEQLTANGTEFSELWAVVENDLKRAEGGMRDLSQTLGGLETTLADTRDAMAAAFGQPFLEAEKDSIRNTIALTEAFTPVVAHLGQIIAAVNRPWDSLKASILQSGPAMKALSAGVIAATNAFILFGAAIAAVQIKVLISSIVAYTAAVRAKAAATKVSTIATAENTLIETINTAATNRGTVAKLAAAAATKTLAVSLSLLRGALGLVKTAFVQTFAVLVANPLIAIGAGLAAAIGLTVIKIQEQAKALRELQQANFEARSAIVDRIKTMQDERDHAETLAAAYERLTEARRKLTELRESGASASLIEAQRAAISQAEADAAKVRNTTGLLPAEKSLEARQEELELAERIREIVLRGELARMSTAQQSLRLAKEQEAIAQRIAEAEERKTARDNAAPRLAALRAQQDALRAELEETQQHLQEGDFEVREVNRADGKRFGVRKVDMEGLRARNHEILQEAKVLQAEIAKIESESAIDLATQRDIENLAELKQQAEELNQSQADIAKRREEAIEKAEELLAVQSKLNEAAQASVDGEEDRAALLREEARELERQADIKARINELTRQGVEQAEAEAQAKREADAAEESRTLRQQLFVQNRELDLTALELENQNTPEGRRKAQALRDKMRFNALKSEFISKGGLSPTEATELAMRQLNAEFTAEKSDRTRVSADSYRSLGLGGNARGSDPLLATAQRQENLLKNIDVKLGTIAQQKLTIN